MQIYSRKEKRRVMRDVEPAGEKVHWSVIERLGRDAIVDEKVRGSYAPRNLPSEWNVRRWREEARRTIEENPKVAQSTKREEDLIDRCREGKNDRRQQCALHCDYSGKPHTGILGPVRNLLSAPLKRDKRMREATQRVGGSGRSQIKLRRQEQASGRKVVLA